MKKLLLTSSILLSLTISGCASTNLEGSSYKVLVTHDKPEKNCKYLGQVTGNQGNFFTGSFTSNKNMEQGAMNDLRNQAGKLGGNYVQLLTNRSGKTGSASVYSGIYSMAQTNVTALGNVFKCPE